MRAPGDELDGRLPRGVSAPEVGGLGAQRHVLSAPHHQPCFLWRRGARAGCGLNLGPLPLLRAAAAGTAAAAFTATFTAAATSACIAASAANRVAIYRAAIFRRIRLRARRNCRSLHTQEIFLLNSRRRRLNRCRRRHCVVRRGGRGRRGRGRQHQRVWRLPRQLLALHQLVDQQAKRGLTRR